MTDRPPPAAEPAGLDAVMNGVLATTLAAVVRLAGGRAGLLMLWDAAAGAPLHWTGVGLEPDDQAEVAALVEHSAPALLGALPVDGAPASVAPEEEAAPEPPFGWQIDAPGAEARIQTRLGRLHLVPFPIATPYAPDEPRPPAEAGAAVPAPTGRAALVGLLVLFHPQPRLHLRAAYPVAYQMAVAQVALVVRNLHLVQQIINEAHWLRAVLDQTRDGVIIVGPRGRVLGANRAATTITGWAPGDLIGRDLLTTFEFQVLTWQAEARAFEEQPWSGPFVAPPEGRMPPAGADAAPLDLVLTSRSGARVYTEGRAAVMHDGGGTLLGAVLSLTDVTAQREAEELQATFLSVISHELQTPLAIIRGYAELLADQAGQLKPRELRQKLGIVAEESAKLSKMVTNLLDASRIQAGGLELKPEPVDLRRLVERVVQKMQPLTGRHQFVVGVSADLPPVLADYERVEQVLTNLLENAVKYSPAGGTIAVTGDLTSDDVIIHISDEGIGVPEADRQRIFSRFHRLSSRQVRQMKGVGLGLYIARAIVGAHGGRIWVDAAPGGGATFSFSLPRQHKAPLPILFGRS